VTNHFTTLVDDAISASERALDSYVSAFMRSQLSAARQRIQDYSDR
jgi:hypothetical protein